MEWVTLLALPVWAITTISILPFYVKSVNASIWITAVSGVVILAALHSIGYPNCEFAR